MNRNDSQLIQKIRVYLDLNLYKRHSIRELCRRFTITRVGLQSGFHAEVGTTVHAYLIRQRMKIAACRLAGTDDPIKAIAWDSGYRRQRSFCKMFKSVYNLTPGKYRQLTRGRNGWDKNLPL